MAKLRVVYTVQHVEYIEWSDVELKDLDYENLVNTLDFDKAKFRDFDEIMDVKKDGEEFYF